MVLTFGTLLSAASLRVGVSGGRRPKQPHPDGGKAMKPPVPVLLAMGIGLSCLASLVAPAPAHASSAGPAPATSEVTLGSLAERYLAGDTQGAVSTVARWDSDTLEAEVTQLLPPKGVIDEGRDRSLRAAAMLVTEAAGHALVANDSDTARWRLEHAASLVDALTAPGSALFARRFYLLSGLALHAVADVEAAYEMLNRALRRFDRDPELQLAMGAAVETIAGLRRYDEGPRPRSAATPVGRAMTGMTPQVGTLLQQQAQVTVKDCFSIEGVHDSSRCMAPQSLQGAEARYVAALSLQPTLLEARLRLGRVRLMGGDARGALRELDIVAAQASDRTQRHLACLFQGAARQELGDLEGAISAYEAAAHEVPDAQSALIALGRARNRIGETNRAQGAFARALAASRSLDPWWLYLHGQPGRLNGLDAELRGLVR
jgi:tetratricopeptide (TPR) repeat protein